MSCSYISVTQILTFMRTNTFVEQEEVLTVVLEDVSASLTYS